MKPHGMMQLWELVTPDAIHHFAYTYLPMLLVHASASVLFAIVAGLSQ